MVIGAGVFLGLIFWAGSGSLMTGLTIGAILIAGFGAVLLLARHREREKRKRRANPGRR